MSACVGDSIVGSLVKIHHTEDRHSVDTLQLRIHSLIQVERFRKHIRRFPKMRVPLNPKFDHPSIRTYGFGTLPI